MSKTFDFFSFHKRKTRRTSAYVLTILRDSANASTIIGDNVTYSATRQWSLSRSSYVSCIMRISLVHRTQVELKLARIAIEHTSIQTAIGVNSVIASLNYLYFVAKIFKSSSVIYHIFNNAQLD